MSDDLDDVKAEVLKTRKALASKLTLLEGEVHERVETTKRKIEDTVETMTAAAKALSPAHQVRKYPLTSVGVAALGGFLATRWLTRSATPPVRLLNTAPSQPSSPSLLSRLGSQYSEEIKTLSTLVIASGLRAWSERVRETSPGMADQLSEVEKYLKAKANKAKGSF